MPSAHAAVSAVHGDAFSGLVNDYVWFNYRRLLHHHFWQLSDCWCSLLWLSIMMSFPASFLAAVELLVLSTLAVLLLSSLGSFLAAVELLALSSLAVYNDVLSSVISGSCRTVGAFFSGCL